MAQDIVFKSQDVRGRVTKLVEEYRRLFFQEYQSFLKAQRVKVNNTDNRFAELKGTSFIERQLGEMPETLFVLLERNLTPEELVWFHTKAGAKWFYNTFTEFRVTKGRV